jgi:imidazolonepropionase-like amidohydrolase
MRQKSFWLALALAAAAVPAVAQQAPVTLIRNATVMTVTQGTHGNTDILLREGRIAAIGRNLSAPAGATVIDATGKYVSPGIVDPHSHLMSDAVNEGTLSVTSMVRIQDVLNPTQVAIYRALAGGVTLINILHGSANTIGGQSATVKLKWERPIGEMLMAGAPPGIKFALGENVTRKNQPAVVIPGQQAPPRRYPATRMGQVEVIRDAFMRAQDYRAAWADYRARLARREQGLVPPRRDLELVPLVEVLEGKRLVHTHSYRADEMHMILEMAKEYGFTIATLQHGLDGYKIAPEIARHGAGLSLFADSWSFKLEAYDAIPYAAAIATRAGVLTTINSDSPERIRRLNIDAAKMIRYGGLSEDEAMALITINGAKQLGVGDRTGSLEAGKDADVVIWTGHPLSVYSRVETTFVDGVAYFDRARDLAQREALARERTALEQAAPNQPPAAQRPGGNPQENR